MNFEITYWEGPRGKQWEKPDVCKNIRDVGMTMALAEESPELNKLRMAEFEKYGLKALVSDSRISRAILPDSDTEKLITEVYNDYKDFSCLYGFHIIDEPSSLRFNDLARVVRAIEKCAPGVEPYINLFPNYASKQQLQNETYEEHVDQFMRICKPPILSYDHYHFCKNNAEPDPEVLKNIKDERERLIYLDSLKTFNRGGFFANLEVIRNAAVKYSTPFMLIVLVIEHGGYRNLTEAEIAYEVYQAMAYGASRMTYFTYACPAPNAIWSWKNACIDYETKPLQHYYDVQHINSGLINVGRALENTVTRAVFHNGKPEKESEMTTAFTKGYGVKSAQGDMTMGFFENGSLLLANKSYTEAQSVSITLESGKTAVRFNKYANTWSEPVTGSLTLNLAAGDGELLKII